MHDLLDFAKEVKAQGNSAPIFVAGQSMGGMVSCLAALRAPEMFAGLLLCSAAIDVERTVVQRYEMSGHCSSLAGMLGHEWC